MLELKVRLLEEACQKVAFIVIFSKILPYECVQTLLVHDEQGLAAQWSSATKDRAKKAKEAFTGLQAKLPEAAVTRSIKGRLPMLLDTANCIKVHHPPPPPPDPEPLARGISDIFASLNMLPSGEDEAERGGGLAHGAGGLARAFSADQEIMA